ncbi:MAG: acyltransferase domain-containing protein [Desulfovibrio sp.]|jgi:malonyl CoA-acyl carrier protein transacylase|nr:acyltransferase domain-containing protein [Desulfovibrio sp.]
MHTSDQHNIHKDSAPPLAVMCCGLGSVWPGMGRELYDNFPAARAAMDRIAAVADWDVLALMDETEIEIISQSRRQLPYLFLLEYAQWSQIASLEIAPSIVCGHSLGEMIALCFAGAYAPEVAWEMMETRARQMVNLEIEAANEAGSKTGMLSVHAGMDVIDDLRRSLPSLYISNYNTPRQFILSGPRDVLLEARKILRARKIPAIVLNVALAFHHPSMRVLREPALYWLNAFEMRRPHLPVLSDVTADFYPQDQPSISRYIADLDENSVRWTECVRVMWDREGIRHFLELGPQDILCGLVDAIEPQALCMPAGRRGKEAEEMLRVCAQLYSLGHVKRKPDIGQTAGRPERRGTPAADAPKHGVISESLKNFLEILATACGRPADELGLEMDLRYDLALRSSRFPALILEAEQRLGLAINFEKLLGVSTVGDLARVLGVDCGEVHEKAQTARPARKNNHQPTLAPPDSCRRGAFVRDFAEQPEISTLVFPDEQSTPSVAGTLRGACHFSRFADCAISTHGGMTQNTVNEHLPHLPVSRAMQAVVDGARLLFPSLVVSGIADMRMYKQPFLPPGITRECRLIVKARPWLRLDRVMTRVCPAELYVRGVTADGRRENAYSHLLGGAVWMIASESAADGATSPFSPVIDIDRDGEGSGVLASFYGALGLGAPWRLLHGFAVLPDDGYQALFLRPEVPIAQNMDTGYTDILYMFEGIVQAAQLAVAFRGFAPAEKSNVTLDALSRWRLGVVRFVRFGEFAGTRGKRRIQLQKTWDDETLLRFNAQVTDERNKVLLVVYNLEFVQRVAAYPACDADLT